MDNSPLVTIVTPSFNQAQFIRDTIESVLTQDYPKIEYIVMDGASTDTTADVVRPYAGRLTFVSEPDRGQSHAINKGFAMAKGEIVAWLNSDDLFLPGAVARAVKAFTDHPQAGVVYGDGYQIDIDGNIKSTFPHTQPHDLWRLVHMSDYILQQSVFVRKSALDAVGPIREDLHYVMDWEILIRLGKQFDFVYVPEHLGSLREYGAAKTFSGGIKRANEIHRMLREHTGKALPEGYIVYGLDSYSQVCVSFVNQLPAVFNGIKKPLEGLILKFAHRILGHVSVHAQGVYRDNWLGKKANFMMRQGVNEIVFAGVVPDLDQLRGQTVTIRSAGITCATAAVGPGPFEIKFNAPPEAANRPATFEVMMSRAFVPSKIGYSQDSRALSLQLLGFRNIADLSQEGHAGTS